MTEYLLPVCGMPDAIPPICTILNASSDDPFMASFNATIDTIHEAIPPTSATNEHGSIMSNDLAIPDLVMDLAMVTGAYPIEEAIPDVPDCPAPPRTATYRRHRKGHPTQHHMLNAGGRPHVCNLCNKTFIFKFDLNRHMKIHSCARCRRSFLKQSSMEEHMLRCKRGMAHVITSNGTPMPLPATPNKREQQPNNIFSSLPSPFNKDSFGKRSMPAMDPQTCLLCSRTISSTAELAVHLSMVHLPQHQLVAQLGQQGIAQQSGTLSNQQSLELEAREIPHDPLSAFLPIKMEELSSADMATNSSCASSPQNQSPSSVEVADSEPRDDAATPSHVVHRSYQVHNLR